MEKKYIAHINEELKTEQTVKEHSENVAMLAEEYAVERFKKIAYVTGLLHDCGKYQESFLKSVYLIATRDLSNLWLQFFYLKIKGLCDFLRKRF